MADVDKGIGLKNKTVEDAMQSKSFKACNAEISELKSKHDEL